METSELKDHVPISFFHRSHVDPTHHILIILPGFERNLSSSFIDALLGERA